MALNLQHQTLTEFAARLRARFRTAEREDKAKLVTWLLARITAGDLTDAQVRNAFGLTTTQYNTRKTAWTALRDQYAAINAAGVE